MKTFFLGSVVGLIFASAGATLTVYLILLLLKLDPSLQTMLIIFGLIICLNIIGVSFSKERWNAMVSLFRGAKK